MIKMTYASVVKKSIGICDESNVKPSDVMSSSELVELQGTAQHVYPY